MKTKSLVQFIAANCPNCGGELRVPDNRDQVKCMYCGHDIIIHDPNKISVEIKANTTNLLGLAVAAEESGNYEEAYSYYSRVLEEDPNNWKAWLGKSTSAGMLSTIANFRIEEMANLFTKSFLAAKETRLSENVIEFVNIASPKALAVLSAAQKYSLDYFKKYIQDDHVWRDYQKRCNGIFYAIDTILNSSPKVAPDILLFGIKVSKELLEGWNYIEVGSLGESVRKAYSDYKLIYFARFNVYISKMKEINPQYVPPEIKEKKQHCFIATATMGSYDHPYVISLRKFRDDVLLKSSLGTKLVEVYYQNSPFFARAIARSSVLRKMSLFLIVKPWVWIAQIINRGNL